MVRSVGVRSAKNTSASPRMPIANSSMPSASRVRPVHVTCATPQKIEPDPPVVLFRSSSKLVQSSFEVVPGLKLFESSLKCLVLSAICKEP